MTRTEVKVEIVKVKRTDGGPDWYAFRITKPGDGSIQLGFCSSPEELEKRWGSERDIFVEAFSAHSEESHQ